MLSLTKIQENIFAQRATQKKIDALPPSLPPVTNKKEVLNLNHYQQVLNQSRLDVSQRKYFQSVIDSIKKQSNLASPNQLVILKKILG